MQFVDSVGLRSSNSSVMIWYFKKKLIVLIWILSLSLNSGFSKDLSHFSRNVGDGKSCIFIILSSILKSGYKVKSGFIFNCFWAGVLISLDPGIFRFGLGSELIFDHIRNT